MQIAKASGAKVFATASIAKHDMVRQLGAVEINYSSTSIEQIVQTFTDGQCLSRKIPNLETLSTEITAWQKQHNQQKSSVFWNFKTTDAPRKMERLYPII